MYASRQYFMDGTCGVRVEHPEHVKVFSMSPFDLQVLAAELDEYSKPTVAREATCHACYRRAPQQELMSCRRCLQLYYCNKV
ncbi:hypothetical protein NKR19_g8905 [Coniochaeta hoffmannii]|uniref:Uncharacterized protein n=1 Tax=Coniochaeta hoffmannii TaxID=91930 RepID=A0AA38R507_9PEZI|nr:hypothetical protein NKR19_g8905 [Coniochaeta hoffmannii]